jgi:undecaprenyl-diphosphatase
VSPKRCFIISMCVLATFFILAFLVFPRANLSFAQMLIAEDTKVFLQANKYHFVLLDQFMILVTQFGRELVWPITIVVLFIFGGDTGKRAAIIMALVMITLIPIGILSKEIVARPRPFIPNTEVILAADSRYAYPSGHSMIVAAGATVALAELYRNSSARMKAVAIALALEASVVCFSRIYVGAHYPLDVLGGILLGGGMSLLFLSQATRIEYLLITIARPFKRRP